MNNSFYLSIVCSIIITIVLFFPGCNKSGNQLVDTSDTQDTPSIPINIIEINAVPDTLLIYETTTFTCETSHNNELTFSWSSIAGAFPAGNTGNSVQWRAPGRTGNHTILVEISNGSVVVTDSVIIYVKIIPSYSYPANGSSFPTDSITLSWECGYDSSWLFLFDVLFGESLPLSAISSKQTGKSYLLGNLEVYKQYYWQIIAYDENDNVFPGPVWTFRTITVSESEFEIGNTGVMIQMVWIPPGDFMMGAPGTSGAGDDEAPSHLVTISSGFWMSKFEVTQAQWKAVLGEREFTFEGDNHPADGTSWFDAKAFIQRLNDEEQNNLWRLPSEAEWEYAARGGIYNTRFWWGDDYSYANVTNYAWINTNSGGRSHEVGTTTAGIPNPYGLWDMGGNLWEWCEDWYHWGYNGAPTDGSAWIEPTGTQRIIRGGSWQFEGRRCLPTLRSLYNPSGNFSTFGFRLVRDE